MKRFAFVLALVCAVLFVAADAQASGGRVFVNGGFGATVVVPPATVVVPQPFVVNGFAVGAFNVHGCNAAFVQQNARFGARLFPFRNSTSVRVRVRSR